VDKEDHSLENDAEMECAGEETIDDEDLDYDQENDHSQDLSQNH